MRLTSLLILLALSSTALATNDTRTVDDYLRCQDAYEQLEQHKAKYREARSRQEAEKEHGDQLVERYRDITDDMNEAVRKIDSRFIDKEYKDYYETVYDNLAAQLPSLKKRIDAVNEKLNHYSHTMNSSADYLHSHAPEFRDNCYGKWRHSVVEAACQKERRAFCRSMEAD